MTVTSDVQAGFYSMGCPDVVRSVDGSDNPPLPKAGQMDQQWWASGENLFPKQILVLENLIIATIIRNKNSLCNLSFHPGIQFVSHYFTTSYYS